MWSLETEYGLKPERWVATIGARNFSDLLAGRRSIELVIVSVDDGYRLVMPGTGDTSHSSLGEAMIAGEKIEAESRETIETEAFAASGLSRDRWKFSYGSFRGLDAAHVVTPVALDRWRATLGSIVVGEAESALDAVRLLEAFPHLPWKILQGLENVYARHTLGVHPDKYAFLVDAGYVVFDDEWNGRLTEAGRDALDADPRTMPTALKEIVFENVVALERERLVREEKHPSLGVDERSAILTVDEARAEFARFFSVTSAGNNPLHLVEALKDGLDLDQDVANTEPHEVVVTATGEYASGSVARGLTVLLLSPTWVGDVSDLLAQAVVRAAGDMRSALDFRSDGLVEEPSGPRC